MSEAEISCECIDNPGEAIKPFNYEHTVLKETFRVSVPSIVVLAYLLTFLTVMCMHIEEVS